MKRHVHDMRPIIVASVKIFKCSSCAFKCATGRSLEIVRARPQVHILTKGDPPVWVAPRKEN